MEKIFNTDLSSEFQTVEIFTLSDLHLGDVLTDLSVFRGFIDEVLKQENRFVILAGDLINNNLKGSVGSVYEDLISPSEQKKMIKSELLPIKDRILVMVSGNHERRTKKEVDQDVSEDVAEYLEVPYQDEDALLKIRFGTRLHSSKPQCYTIYVTHGFGGGKKPGATLNNIESLSMNIVADVYIVGHSHKKIVHKAVLRVPDLRNGTITEMEQLFVTTSHYQTYGGYAKTKGYRPQVKGTVPITLYGNVKKTEAVL